MNDQLKNLYIVISDNNAVGFETNLTQFVMKLNASLPGTRNYAWFSRRFKSSIRFSELIGGKVYHFQKLK